MDPKLAASDIPAIARGQLASEDALARAANRLLVCDTDVLATVVWSETLFGECPAWIRQEADRRCYDLTLLTDVDVPWVRDPVRYLPGDRAGFLDRCVRALDARGRRTLKLSGPHEQRLAQATLAIQELLSRRR